MKRLVLAAATMIVVALASTPIASAHTGTATITCDSVTFSFEQFKDPTTVIHELVRIDGVKVAETDYTLTGPAGGNTVTIDVPSGTHTVVARAEWSDSEGDSFFRVSRVVSGCDEPAGACVFTKGYYRNHESVTASLVAAAGGTLRLGNRNLNASRVQSVLDATPGKPGNVTFTSNVLLNLAQQLLSAELNLARHATAPAVVLDAINAANNGIRVNLSNGLIAIRTTLGQSARSDLVDTLSSFNEGQFGEASHCDS